MQEEGLTKEEATDKVITENLHGLELDPRCTQLAAFNLALTAWKFCGHYKELPEMNLACSGLAPKGKLEDWVKLVSNVPRDDRGRMENGMKLLYQHFQQAPDLGSLLDPSKIKADMYTATFEELQPILVKALATEVDEEQLERGVMAAGIAKAGEILSHKYTLQITNVPYLSRGKQDNVIAEYCAKHYPEAKGDLATVFLDKMLQSNTKGGISCSVIPQNWLFLTSYKKFREKLLNNTSWSIVARLGIKGFQTPMWDFNIILISIQHKLPTITNLISGFDVSTSPNAAAKDVALKTTDLKCLNQFAQLTNPDARIVITDNDFEELLLKYADGVHGFGSKDSQRFFRKFWEIICINEDWQLMSTTIESTTLFGGLEQIVFWQQGKGILAELGKKGLAVPAGEKAWKKKGIAVSQIGNLPCSLHMGNIFDKNVAVILPKNQNDLAAIWSFCKSKEFNEQVRIIDQAFKVTNSTLVKVPFNLEYWQNIATEKYPFGLPDPYSNDPTQWIFHGHPLDSISPLQVSLSRLLGYRWPAETDTEMELENIAKDYISAINKFNKYTDEDGVLCIPSVNGETSAADQLRSYIQKVWDDAWLNDTIEGLLQKEGSSKSNLEDWLREEFFSQHCKIFQNRPFIWHIWDGRKDGFGALVNYHTLTKEKLQKLIYTYLGDWIRQCESRLKSGLSGADGQLSAAKKLKEKLELILEGEAPYDIFVRWKKLEEQPIGWDPDLNDGVRLNIRPFIEADVLRKKPNIKYGIDRGNNPPGSPWGEKRDNDRHLTLEEKRKARKKQN